MKSHLDQNPHCYFWKRASLGNCGPLNRAGQPSAGRLLSFHAVVSHVATKIETVAGSGSAAPSS